MANVDISHPKNAPGSLFVDLSCIDCGTCYHLGPELFEEGRDDHSFVKSQPVTPHDWLEAKTAMISCPTNSIGVTNPPEEFKEALVQLPSLIAENVSYCGFTAADSFGASSYLIELPEGNILIDSPRFHPTLVKELEERGGIKWMILTHRDDVADHEKFAAHFGCKRVIHIEEISGGTQEIEEKLSFTGTKEFLHLIRLIHVPGHTKGHMVIAYKDRYLFTGDHIFFDSSREKLSASRRVCWYSWSHQIESVRVLLNQPFAWILPGHGGWGHVGTRSKEKLEELIKNMEGQ